MEVLPVRLIAGRPASCFRRDTVQRHPSKARIAENAILAQVSPRIEANALPGAKLRKARRFPPDPRCERPGKKYF